MDTDTVAADELVRLRVHATILEVREGPDAGRSARIEQPCFVVGSGPGADLQLTDGTVSREHVRIFLEPTGVRVRDGDSKNGTWLGAVRIKEASFASDTVLALGATKIAIRIEADAMDLDLSARASFGDAQGVSAAMRHLFALLERAAASDVTVLLEGESGVGKEVLAQAIHAKSPRAEGPFIGVDCGAIPMHLIESELFGHERGAFTGAVGARQGVFEQANGGTLFLDEIGELTLDLQPKLLRALETREIRPIGGRGVRPVDVRVIAATSRRLAEAAHKNEFRPDLFYRLAVARVVVPPLRDRPEDIEPLAQSFLQTALGDPRATLPADLTSMLRSYAWPGNVRELRNVIERYALLGIREPSGLFDHSSSAHSAIEELADLPFREAKRIAVERFERDYIERVLERCDGVVARAADHAEVARPSFYRMMDRTGLKGDDR